MARQKTRPDRGGEEVPHPDPTERYERWERDFFAAQKELAAIREEIAVATERQRELSERQREISGRCVALLEKLPGCLLQPSPPLSTSGGRCSPTWRRRGYWVFLRGICEKRG